MKEKVTLAKIYLGITVGQMPNGQHFYSNELPTDRTAYKTKCKKISKIWTKDYRVLVKNVKIPKFVILKHTNCLLRQNE